MPSLKSSYPLYLANRAMTPNQDLVVTDKFTGEVATRVALADPAIIDQAIAAAVRATGSRSAPTNWPMPCASRRASRSATRVAR